MYIVFKIILRHLEDFKSVNNTKAKAKNAFKVTKGLLKIVLRIVMVCKEITPIISK